MMMVVASWMHVVMVMVVMCLTDDRLRVWKRVGKVS
jgi:hypothetical protein